MKRKSILQNIFVGLILICLTASTALAQTTAFNFQGRLNDGTTPANSSYDLQFRLYDAIVGGNQIGALAARPNTTLINGVFSVTLDFGATAFKSPNSIFIEIAVRPNGNPNAYTILGPRQQLTVVPFAGRAANATLADNATKLGGVDASQYATTTSNSFIKNSFTQQAAEFNVSGNGVVGGSLGIGAAPGADIRLDVGGAGRFRNPNGNVNFGSPNGETGMTVTNTNRADFRFNGSTLKLVAGFGVVPPAETNGITINTLGNVGIGTTSPATKLYVAGNTGQDVSSRGFVKALISVEGTINSVLIRDCYNGVSGENYTTNTLTPCSFSVSRVGANAPYPILITFPFSIRNRFFSLTEIDTSAAFSGYSPAVNVTSDNTLTVYGAGNNFHIMVF